MEKLDAVLSFMNFAPLIQFIGGVYLLLMYDKVLNQNPLNHTVLNLSQELSDFHHMINIEAYNVSFKADDFFTEKWNKDISIRFRRLNILMLSYCIMLLAFIGFESYDVLTHYNAYIYRIATCNTIVLLYFILSICGVKNRIMVPWIWISLLLVAFHTSPFFNNFITIYCNVVIFNISCNQVILFTLVTTVLGFVFIAINWIFMNYRLSITRAIIETLSNEVKALTYHSLIGDEDILNKLRESTKDKLVNNMPKDKETIGSNVFDVVIKDITI